MLLRCLLFRVFVCVFVCDVVSMRLFVCLSVGLVAAGCLSFAVCLLNVVCCALFV